MATEAQRHRAKKLFIQSDNPASVPLCLGGKALRRLCQLGCIIVFGVFGVFGLVAALAQTLKLPGPEQPIAFSHKLHAGEQGLKCATCHKNPDPGEKMGLASAALCMQCHSDVKTESPEIQKLAVYANEKREIKWRRVYEIPSYVFFSHRAHTTAGASCADCHGQVKELAQMYRAVELSMASCMNCHQAKGASFDCTFCHDKMN